MSRVGKEPIPIPNGVEVTIDTGHVAVKGPKGELERQTPTQIAISRSGDELVVTRPTTNARTAPLHGLVRSLVNNMVVGVSDGFSRDLEIVGVGYRATAQGPNRLELQVGFSHPVVVEAPDGVTFEVPVPTRISVRGFDKQLVGRSPPTSASSASPSPTRARASATPASACCARPASRRSDRTK